MVFFDMLEALPPEERERVLREQFSGYSAGPGPAAAAPFVCEPFDEPAPEKDERKP